MKNRWIRFMVLLLAAALLSGCGPVKKTKTIVLKDEKRQSEELLQSDKIYQYDFNGYPQSTNQLRTSVWGEEKNTIITLLRNGSSNIPKLQKVDYRFGFFEDYGKVPHNIQNVYSISPGGRYMIYSAEIEEQIYLMAMNLVSGNTRKLTVLYGQKGLMVEPVGAWSGDGMSYFFTKVNRYNDSAVTSLNSSIATSNSAEYEIHKVMKFDAKTTEVEEIKELTKFYRSQPEFSGVDLNVSYNGNVAALDGYGLKNKAAAVYKLDSKKMYTHILPYGETAAVTEDKLYQLVANSEILVMDLTSTDDEKYNIIQSFDGNCTGFELLPNGKGAVVQIERGKSTQVMYYEIENNTLKNKKLLYQYTDKWMSMKANAEGTGVMLLETSYKSMVDGDYMETYGKSMAVILRF